MLITANRASAILYRFIKSVTFGTYILPANICPVVPLTFVKAGIPFEFVDIDCHTLCMDELQVIQKLMSKDDVYAGIVFVRTYGYQYDTSKFFAAIKQIDDEFKIIDDKCLCSPDFEPLENNVDLQIYSTGYAKPVDLGVGGFAKIKDEILLKEYHQKADPKAYEMLEDQYKKSFSNNLKFESPVSNWLEISDISLSDEEYFNKIEKQLELIKLHKQRINEIYIEKLKIKNHLKSDFNNWRFNLLVENKNQILQNIFQSGLFASSHYQPANLLFDDNHYPISEKLFTSVINLFNDFYFSEEQATKLCDVINKSLL